MSIYDVCLIGPSRVGKTTLISSMIYDFQKIAEEIYQKSSSIVHLKALGNTYERVADCMSIIDTNVKVGVFDTGCLMGTQQHEVYELGIEYATKISRMLNPQLKICFHDFRGGDLKGGVDSEGLLDMPFDTAEVMVLPIDAALLMESASHEEMTSAKRQLLVKQVEDIVKLWAESRKKDACGLFLLVPVKCETYCMDNPNHIDGFLSNRSNDLYNMVNDDNFYGSIIKMVHDKCPAIETWYMPVDTIGCCSIVRKKWIPDPVYGKSLAATYKIPPNSQWCPFGPAEVMLKILDYFIRRLTKTQTLLEIFLNKVGISVDLLEELEEFKDKYKTSYSRARKIS